MTKQELKDKIADYTKRMANASLPESAKNMLAAKIKEFQSELEEDEKPEPKTKEKPEPKTKEKKSNPKKDIDKPKALKKKPSAKTSSDKKEGTKFEYKGEVVSKETIAYCTGLLEEWRKKRQNKKKATPSKRKSTSERVAASVVKAVKGAVEEISDNELDEAPKKVVTKIQRLMNAADEFLSAFKEVLGDDYDEKEMQKEMRPLEILLEDIKEKFIK